MSDSGRAYTRGASGAEVSPGLLALKGIEKYVRGLIAEVNSDLKDLELPEASMTHSAARAAAVKSKLLARKHAYREVLQFIKDGKGIL